MEAELQALRRQNEELMSALGEQQELVASERLHGDRRARAQMQELANLITELLAGRQGPAVQLDGMRFERQSREIRTVRWPQGEGSRYLAISSAQTSGVVDCTSKRIHPIRRIFVTRKRNYMVEGDP